MVSSSTPVDSARLRLRIGDSTGVLPHGFGTVRGLAVDAAGRLWVLDGRAMEIAVFDSAGRFVRRIGRRGSGPGEYQQPAALLSAPDGTIWVDDPGNARLTALDTAGRPLRMTTVPRACLQARPWPATFDGSGRYIGIGGADCHLVVRFDTAFVEERRAAAPIDPRPPRVLATRAGTVALPFTGEVVWRPARDTTLWALQTDSYRLSRLSLSGDTLLTRRVPFDREPLSPADRALAQAFLAEAAKDGAQTQNVSLPSTRPAAVAFFIADDGMLWVERYTDPDRLGTRWEVIDPRSVTRRRTVVSDVPLARFPTPVVRGTRVYAAVEDSLGTPQVAVFDVSGR